jgi:hypothetical protein
MAREEFQGMGDKTTDKEKANLAYRTFTEAVNQKLGIDEPIQDIDDNRLRQIALECMTKMSMATTDNWKYLTMDGKIYQVVSLLEDAERHTRSVFGNGTPFGTETDFTQEEISNMIIAIESKSKIFGL